VLAGAGALLAGAAVLVLFPPERYGFYPRCPFFEVTGLLCPGCGGTRALATLLHGNIAGALRLNGFVVALLPFAAGCGLRWLHRGEVRVPRGVWIGLALVAGVFGVWRNLQEHLSRCREPQKAIWCPSLESEAGTPGSIDRFD
jgi:hypothetical protein